MTESEILLIKRLSDAYSPSGDESEVLKIAEEEIKPYADSIEYDAMGNLLAKKGQSVTVFAAHADEVGFMVKSVNADGTLAFGEIGGIDPRFLASKAVRFKNGTRGVIMSSPVHFSKKNDSYTPPKISDLLIDIGSESLEETKKKVNIGDCCVFDTASELSFDKKSVFGKALDNRIGIFLLIKLMKDPEIKDLFCAFTVQEETGCRGAAAVSSGREFSSAVAVDTTTAFDMPHIPNNKTVAKLNNGCVVSFVDGATVYPSEIVRNVFELCAAEKISIQTKTMTTGGNDAYTLQKFGGGHKILSVSTPARYIHSAVAEASFDDILSSYRCLFAIANSKGVWNEHL